MKLIIPYTGELDPVDARLVRLAKLFGIDCEALLLDRQDRCDLRRIEEASRRGSSCLVVNPQVIRNWMGASLPRDLAPCLLSSFRYLFLHGLVADTLSRDLAKVLSGDRLQNIQGAGDSGAVYEMAENAKDVCGPFAGISFGPVNRPNDHVFCMEADHADLRTPISIGGKPFMALAKRDSTEVLILGSADVLDLNSPSGYKPLSEYFSRLVPHAMALRYIFGEQCWQPLGHWASLTIDDPLLHPKYGYLDFESLVGLMKTNNFATTIAFIPHNYRRSSERTVRLFHQNSDRLAICFHGNDHTEAEFASMDVSLLNTRTEIAEARMENHAKATGVPCNKVMVFPQDNYSVAAMEVLKARNYFAAVSGALEPYRCRADITFGELAQPAILRYGGLPLFVRRYVGRFEQQDIACDLFFGKPVLIYEHHGMFRQSEMLVEAVRSINSITPEIRWCDLATVLMNSGLRRITSDGVYHIHAYSGTARISNDSDLPRRFDVEWDHSEAHPRIESVLSGGVNLPFEIRGPLVHVQADLAPRSSQTFSLEFRNEYGSFRRLGFHWKAKAFARRRLSELRDNYISKNDVAMTIAQSVKRRLLSKVL